MTKTLLATELAALLGVEAPEGAPARLLGVCADSRNVAAGEIFVALRGVVQDGHDHVAEALAAGAGAAIVEASWQSGTIEEQRLWRVDSTLAAYQALAAHHRRRFTVPVVAVTGSVGKTTTKELIVAAMRSAGSVLATPGNFNNEVGVPQTLLQLDARHRCAVLEMGMRGVGQIAELAAVARANVGVITNVGTAHIGLMGSREAIARTKCELLEHLSADGLAVLHHDPLLLEMAAKVWSGRTVTFGLQTDDSAANLAGRFEPPASLRLAEHRFELPLPGAHHGLAMLATLAVARELGVPWDGLAQLRLELPPGRGRRVDWGGTLLLDESYNAGPESMRAALELLKAERCERRIAVLGAMLELGDHALELHRQVGGAVAELGVDALLLLGAGPEIEALERGAAAVPCQRFDDHDKLVAHLRGRVGSGDAVLFKASRSVGLDRVVAALVDSDPSVEPDRS